MESQDVPMGHLRDLRPVLAASPESLAADLAPGNRHRTASGLASRHGAYGRGLVLSQAAVLVLLSATTRALLVPADVHGAASYRSSTWLAVHRHTAHRDSTRNAPLIDITSPESCHSTRTSIPSASTMTPFRPAGCATPATRVGTDVSTRWRAFGARITQCVLHHTHRNVKRRPCGWTVGSRRCYAAAAMDFERLRENGHPRANEDSSPPPEPTTGAQQRYVDRIRLFAEDGRGMPRLRHHAFWMLHNCVAHPLLAIGRPRRSTVTTEFHEITSHWLNHESMTAFGTQLDSLRASLKQADEDMEDAVECADRAARSLRRWKT